MKTDFEYYKYNHIKSYTIIMKNIFNRQTNTRINAYIVLAKK